MTSNVDNAKNAIQDSLDELERILDDLSIETVRDVPERGNWVDNIHYVRQQIPAVRRIVKDTLADTDKQAVQELLGLIVTRDRTVSESRFSGYLARLSDDIRNTNQPNSTKIAAALSSILDVLRKNIEDVLVSPDTRQQDGGSEHVGIAFYYSNRAR